LSFHWGIYILLHANRLIKLLTDAESVQTTMPSEQLQHVQEAPFGVAKQVGAQGIPNRAQLSGNKGPCQHFQTLELHLSHGLHDLLVN
jgi:hypothetical protein